jgi:starvation-inducible DNA-binding protein
MELAEQLKKLFATNFNSYVLSHGYHQNLEGDDFYEYHKLFQKIYEYLQDNIDTQGELIRAIDEVVPFSLKRIEELTEVKDVDTVPDIPTMVTDIDAALYTLIDLANGVFEQSQTDKEYGVNNYTAGYIQDLNKFCWMLKASSQGTQDK